MMKTLKIAFIIVKNFFPVILGEIGEFLRNHRLFRWLFVIFLFALLAGGGIWIWNQTKLSALEGAAGEGNPQEYKLVSEILTPDKIMDESEKGHLRGDILDIKDKEHKFLPAESARYVIVKVELTKKQAEILGLKTKDNSQFRSNYAVDLKKIGISDNDYRGREVEAIYKWDIVYKKE